MAINFKDQDEFKITWYTENNGASTEIMRANAIGETLRNFGLNYTVTDAHVDETVVITISPVAKDNSAALQERIDQATEILEG